MIETQQSLQPQSTQSESTHLLELMEEDLAAIAGAVIKLNHNEKLFNGVEALPADSQFRSLLQKYLLQKVENGQQQDVQARGRRLGSPQAFINPVPGVSPGDSSLATGNGLYKQLFPIPSSLFPTSRRSPVQIVELSEEELGLVPGDSDVEKALGINHNEMAMTNNPYYIDALLYSNEARWGNNGRVEYGPVAPGESVVITYSFMTSVPSYYDVDNGQIDLGTPFAATNFTAFTSDQRFRTVQALNEYSKIANITFVEDSSGNGTLKFGAADLFNTAPGQPDPLGIGYPPHYKTSGDVWIDKIYPHFTPTAKGYQTLLHEIGHAISLWLIPRAFSTSEPPGTNPNSSSLNSTICTGLLAEVGKREEGRVNSFLYSLLPVVKELSPGETPEMGFINAWGNPRRGPLACTPCC